MASRSLGTLTLDLIARIGGFRQGMDQAARIADQRSKKIEQSFSRVGRLLAGGFALVGGTALIRKIIEATNAQEQAFAQVEAGIKSTGGAAGLTAQQLALMAREMQKTTVYGDELVLEMQSLLLSFTNIKGDNFKRASEAAADLATRMGTDLKSAALLVGKALADPTRRAAELSRSGIVLSDTQKELIRTFQATGQMAKAQAVILDELAVEFGGSARAARDTFSGAIKAAQNALGDLLEGSNGAGLKSATAELNKFTELLQDPQTAESADKLVQGLIFGLGKVVALLSEIVEGLNTLFGSGASQKYALEVELEFLENKQSASGELPGFLSGIPTDIPVILNLGAFDEGGLFLTPSEIKDRIADIKAELAGLTYDRGGPRSRGGARRSTREAAPPLPTEDFLKQEAALKKQIALFGEVGLAASIAYDIANGGLGDMLPQEEQRILRLARTLDALKAQADATKELEAAQKKLNDAVASQTEAYQSQITLERYKQELGVVEELTEVQRIRYEVEYAGLQGIAPEQAARLEQLAAEVDKLNELREAREDAQRAAEEWARVYEEVRTPAEKLAAELERLKTLYEQSGMTDEDAAVLVAASKKAVEEFQKAAEEVSTFAEQASRNVQDILANFLEDPFRDGLDGLVRDFGVMLQRMAAQAVAADIAGKIFGTGVGGTGGWLDAILGGFKSFVGGAAEGGTIPVGKFAAVGERGPELAFVGQRFGVVGKRGPEFLAADSAPITVVSNEVSRELIRLAASTRELYETQDITRRMSSAVEQITNRSDAYRSSRQETSRELIRLAASTRELYETQDITRRMSSAVEQIINRSDAYHSSRQETSRELTDVVGRVVDSREFREADSSTRLEQLTSTVSRFMTSRLDTSEVHRSDARQRLEELSFQLASRIASYAESNESSHTFVADQNTELHKQLTQAVSRVVDARKFSSIDTSRRTDWLTSAVSEVLNSKALSIDKSVETTRELVQRVTDLVDSKEFTHSSKSLRAMRLAETVSNVASSREHVTESSRDLSQLVSSFVDSREAVNILLRFKQTQQTIDDVTGSKSDLLKRMLEEAAQSRAAMQRMVSIFSNMLGFADGGYLPPNRLALTGERGPELIFGGPTGKTIVSNEVLTRFFNSPQTFPTRDIGGRVTTNQIYQIGVGAQPEWFIPDRPGTMVPAQQLSKEMNVNNNFTIQAPQGSVSRQTQQQIAAAVARGMAEASRRNN